MYSVLVITRRGATMWLRSSRVACHVLLLASDQSLFVIIPLFAPLSSRHAPPLHAISYPRYPISRGVVWTKIGSAPPHLHQTSFAAAFRAQPVAGITDIIRTVPLATHLASHLASHTHTHTTCTANAALHHEGKRPAHDHSQTVHPPRSTCRCAASRKSAPR